MITENTFNDILSTRYASGEDILAAALYVLDLEAQVGARIRESIIRPMTNKDGSLLSSQERNDTTTYEDVKSAAKQTEEARRAHKKALEAFDRKYGKPEEMIKTLG